MKRFLAVLMACVLLCGAAAAETIEVFYNDIQLYVNGSLTEVYDGNGNYVEPFIYNGNVYLPLPAVAQALGVSYSWDGGTMSAYLGAQPGENQYLLDVCPPYQESAAELYTTAEGNSFEMAGQSYTNGLKFSNWGYDKFALFNLNGQYSRLKFTVGHVDGEAMEDVTFQIYLDGQLAGEYPVSAEGLPCEYTLDLNHALSMKITAAESFFHYAGMADITIE